MKKILMSAAALSLLAAPAMANTKDIDAKINEKFSKYDTDKNGSLSAAEIESAKDDKFAEADTNNDGAVSKAELKAKWEEKKADHKSE